MGRKKEKKERKEGTEIIKEEKTRNKTIKKKLNHSGWFCFK